MSTDRDRLTPDEARARGALRALGVPAADAAFRARSAREFVAGVRPAPPVVLGPSWFRRPVVWGAMAAAAALIVVGVGAINRGPSWHVVEARGEGEVTIGYAPAWGMVPVVPAHAPLSSAAGIERALRSGRSVAVPDSAEVTLVAEGTLALRLTSGTRITLPRSPGRWFGRDRVVDVASGELFVSTGQDFRGAGLRIRTREATVAVTGTTFAVLAHEHGTCVCVMEGVVQVTPTGGRPEEVSTGRRCFIYNDGRPEDHDRILPESEAGLSGLLRATRRQLRR